MTAIILTAVVPTRGRRICIYVHISMYLRAFSSAWAPRGALSLRFPVFGGLGRSELTFSNVSVPLTLSLDACAAKRAQPVWNDFFSDGILSVPGVAGNH